MAHHEIPATPENMVLGYLDATTPPVLTVESGDTVLLHSFPAGGRDTLPKHLPIPADYQAALDALPITRRRSTRCRRGRGRTSSPGRCMSAARSPATRCRSTS